MQPNNQRPSMDGVHRPTITPTTPPANPSTPKVVETPLLEAPDEPRITAGGSVPSLDMQSPESAKQPRRWPKRLLIGVITIIAALLSMLAGGYVWYQQQLAPVSSDTSKHVRVTIESGASPKQIVENLKSAGVIRSQLAFALYTRFTDTQNNLKAGTYNLQPSLSTPAIVDHLVEGKQDTFQVTFLPGDTLANNRKILINLGYNVDEVDAALAKKYNRPLFATKPATADLEGYFYGETIEFGTSATIESILNRFFDEYEAVITDNKLVDEFKKQGLTLYQGITLASIVQREVPDGPDQAQVARVFLNRMKEGMTLGSDVTYQYAAKKLGVAPTPDLDSPYNTRKYPGLPPGPIASPGESALLAVANPASNDYLFFLSGDDDVTYFAKTDAQHQQNITDHCKKKCLIY